MSNITQFFGSGGGGDITSDYSRYEVINPNYENYLIITSSTTFVVPPNTKAIKFAAVGGGQAGVGVTGGPGGGYFEKNYTAPFTGLTTSFQLTIGAAGGNTILKNSAGTTIATAFGATAISGTNPVGIGGTSSGGDVNVNGSPGGTSPGVGGASGGKFGSGQYNATYAGRWVYFNESLINQTIRNQIFTDYFIRNGNPLTFDGYFSGGWGGNGSSGTPDASLATKAGGPGGFGGDGGPGGDGATPNVSPPITTVGGRGGHGGFGGNGGPGGQPVDYSQAGGPGGNGGFGGFGGVGGPGDNAFYSSPTSLRRSSSPGGPGGPGGFGGGGGYGGPGGNSGTAPTPTGGPIPGSPGGPGGPGGFGGGGGGAGNNGSGPVAGPTSGGLGGPGAIIIQWTTKDLTI